MWVANALKHWWSMFFSYAEANAWNTSETYNEFPKWGRRQKAAGPIWGGVAGGCPLCDVVGNGFVHLEKMTLLKFFDMHLVVFDIFSQYLVTHGPPEPPPHCAKCYSTSIKFSHTV